MVKSQLRSRLKKILLKILRRMVLRHVVIQTGLLHERLPAYPANFPSVSSMYPLVQIQGRFPQERLLTKPAVVVLNRLMFILMLVHTFEAEGLVFAKLALIFLA